MVIYLIIYFQNTLQYSLFLHEANSKTVYTNLLKKPFLLVTNFFPLLLQWLFGIPLQTSINLVTITLDVNVCHDYEPVDQNDFENSTEQGEGREEKLDVCNLLQELHPQYYPYKTQSLSSPSWFEEAKYVHKTMPILLINILRHLLLV